MKVVYVESERMVRSTDEPPGILSISGREEHDFGAWGVDCKFEPPKKPLTKPVLQSFLPDEDTSDRLTIVDTAELIDGITDFETAGMVWRLATGSLQATVDMAIKNGDFRAVQGVAKLAEETAKLLIARFPEAAQ